MLMSRLKSKETNEIKTNMSKSELLNRLIKFKMIIEESEKEEMINIYNLRLKQSEDRRND